MRAENVHNTREALYRALRWDTWVARDVLLEKYWAYPRIFQPAPRPDTIYGMHRAVLRDVFLGILGTGRAGP